jgi:hypothetical protein
MKKDQKPRLVVSAKAEEYDRPMAQKSRWRQCYHVRQSDKRAEAGRHAVWQIDPNLLKKTRLIRQYLNMELVKSKYRHIVDIDIDKVDLETLDPSIYS